MTDSLTPSNRAAVISWCLYDWAISAFSTIIFTFVFAAYFTERVASDSIVGTHQWGITTAIAAFIVAFISPICGAIADYSGRRKLWLCAFTTMTIISASLLWYAYPNPSSVSLVLYCLVLGLVGLEVSMVFYNAMLPNLVEKKYFGRVSGWAWALGYAGGLLALMISLLCFVQAKPTWLNITTAEHIRITGPFTALWILVFSIPIFIWVHDFPSANLKMSQAIKKGLSDLWLTLLSLPKQKNILLFLLAHMIYGDGLHTIFAFGGVYAAGTFHLTLPEILKLGILLNFVAGIGALVFAWIDDYIGAKPTILISLLGLTVFGVGLVIIHSIFWFWILMSGLSLFVGPVQAASRSLMARLVPAEKATELFGFYAFSGKVTTFLGPWLLAEATLHFASQRVGMSTVFLFFIAGGILLFFVKEP